MKYHFKIFKNNSSMWAQCIELPGCITQAKSKSELEKNMIEALNLFLEEPENSNDLYSLPDNSIKKSKNIYEVQVNPLIAFSFLIKHLRLKNGLTQKQVAKKMGFDTLFSYQRLENKQCNPNLKTIIKIKETYPDFSIDFILN